MQVVYVGPEEEVEIAVGFDSILAVRGEPVEVPDEIANGAAPRGKPPAEQGPDDDGDYWPGTSGLLAQADLWAPAGGAPPAPPPPPPPPTPPADDPEDAR